MSRFSDAEISNRIDRLNRWLPLGEAITKAYEFPNFPAAVAFVVRVGFLAEEADHHPDIDIRYRRVTVTLTTHEAGGLTEKDFALAAAIDDSVAAGCAD